MVGHSVSRAFFHSSSSALIFAHRCQTDTSGVGAVGVVSGTAVTTATRTE